MDIKNLLIECIKYDMYSEAIELLNEVVVDVTSEEDVIPIVLDIINKSNSFDEILEKISNQFENEKTIQRLFLEIINIYKNQYETLDKFKEINKNDFIIINSLKRNVKAIKGL